MGKDPESATDFLGGLLSFVKKELGGSEYKSELRKLEAWVKDTSDAIDKLGKIEDLTGGPRDIAELIRKVVKG